MSRLLALLLNGIAAFVITNIDDMFLPIFFFSQTGPDLKKRHIVLGQYLGFAVLARLYPIEAEKASFPAWQYMIVQEFFRYRAEKTTYKKFETA